MIIFKKLPDGTWQKSGEILPTESHYRIAVDAENPEATAYLASDAVREVEQRTKVGTQSYRYELAMPPTTFLKAACEHAEKAIKKILATPKSKPPKKRKETGKQRRARLKREGLCTACGKRKARKGRTECKSCSNYYRNWAVKARKN
jgi:hypothetical protein